MNNELSNNPVFIGGHRKTGTTMLVCLLDSHHQLNTFPTDSGFFYAYYPNYETLKYSNEERVNRVISFMFNNLKNDIKSVNYHDFPFDNLIETFKKYSSKGTYSSKEMLIAMISSYQKVCPIDSSKHIKWVEKTTSSEIYAKYIFDWFPQAKFINVIRDPRDNYASLKSGWNDQYQHRESNDVRWLMHSMIERGKLCMELAKYNEKRFGKNKYLIIKYEDITSNTKQSMEKISEFIDIEYDKILLTPTVCGKLWCGNNFDGVKFVKPSNVNVNRWKERITENESKIIEYYFRDIMKYFDYQTVFSINECIDSTVEYYKWYNYSQVSKV